METKGTPLDYSDERIAVYFEIVKYPIYIKTLERLDFIENFDINYLAHGFEVNIAIQQIPEVISYLTENKVPIYAVIPKSKKYPLL